MYGCVSELDSLMSVWMGSLIAADAHVSVCGLDWGGGGVELNEPH